MRGESALCTHTM